MAATPGGGGPSEGAPRAVRPSGGLRRGGPTPPEAPRGAARPHRRPTPRTAQPTGAPGSPALWRAPPRRPHPTGDPRRSGPTALAAHARTTHPHRCPRLAASAGAARPHRRPTPRTAHPHRLPGPPPQLGSARGRGPTGGAHPGRPGPIGRPDPAPPVPGSRGRGPTGRPYPGRSDPVAGLGGAGGLWARVVRRSRRLVGTAAASWEAAASGRRAPHGSAGAVWRKGCVPRESAWVASKRVGLLSWAGDGVGDSSGH